VACCTAGCKRVAPARVAARDPQLGLAIAGTLLSAPVALDRSTQLLVQYRPDSAGQPIIRAWRLDSATGHALRPISRDSAAPRLWRGRAAIFGIDSVVEDRAYVTVRQDGCVSSHTEWVTVERVAGRWQGATVNGSLWADGFPSPEELAALGCRR